MMSASHANRRTRRRWEGLAVERLAHAGLVEAVAERFEVDQHERARPGAGLPTRASRVIMAMNASALSWSNVRPSSGFAFSAATAASNAADNRASASGSRLICVWHMPSRSVHRRTARCERSFWWWRRPSSWEIRRARSRTLRANVSTDVDAASATNLGRHRRQLDALVLVEPVGRSGDRIAVTGRQRPRRQRRMHIRHRLRTPPPDPRRRRPRGLDRRPPAQASSFDRDTTAASIESSQQRSLCNIRGDQLQLSVHRTSSRRSLRRPASRRRDRWPT